MRTPAASGPLSARRLLAGPLLLLLALAGPQLPRPSDPVPSGPVPPAATAPVLDHADPEVLPRSASSGGGSRSGSWSRSLRSAIDRVPDRRARDVRWVVSRKYGSWGTADWYRGTIYISPEVPERRLYDVVVHEWAHLVSTYPYPSVDRAVAAMNGYFGGSGLTGAERAADCMSRLQQASWTGYTSCESAHWRRGAARLLKGQAL